MKVLIADDDPIARAVLDAALRSLGHEAVIACDGIEAWNLYHEQKLRVVVSDWLMPGLDGLELCRRIRATPGEYTYFILLTHLSATHTNEQQSVEAGVDDFLRKPVDPHELWKRLRVATRILEFTKQVRRLESFLPICGYCKKIRDDRNYWSEIEEYISAHTGSQFSHAICPSCIEKVVRPEMEKLGIPMPPELLQRPSEPNTGSFTP